MIFGTLTKLSSSHFSRNSTVKQIKKNKFQRNRYFKIFFQYWSTNIPRGNSYDCDWNIRTWINLLNSFILIPKCHQKCQHATNHIFVYVILKKIVVEYPNRFCFFKFYATLDFGRFQFVWCICQSVRLPHRTITSRT